MYAQEKKETVGLFVYPLRPLRTQQSPKVNKLYFPRRTNKFELGRRNVEFVNLSMFFVTNTFRVTYNNHVQGNAVRANEEDNLSKKPYVTKSKNKTHRKKKKKKDRIKSKMNHLKI